MAKPTPKIKRIISSYDAEAFEIEKLEKEGVMVHVSEVVSRAAFFYEKIRNAVEFKDEHLLRKNAVERILKRRWYEVMKGERIAEELLKELIRAGYLSNNSLPESKIDEVDEILNKYHDLLKLIKESGSSSKPSEVSKWLIGLAAVEIEENIITNLKEKAFIKAMFMTLKSRTDIVSSLPEEKKDLYLYIAVNKTLIKSDAMMINFLIFRLFYPSWKNDYTQILDSIATDIDKVKSELEVISSQRLTNRLAKIAKRYAVYYQVLKEVIDKTKEDGEDLDQILDDPNLLKDKVKLVCTAKYKTIRGKIIRGVFRAIIYIFITKMAIALLIEYPFDKYVMGHIDYQALLINVLFPPILMLLIGLTIRTPSKKNTEKIVEEVNGVVYGFAEDKKELIKPPRKRNKTLNIIFGFIYLFTYVISFGLIIWGLYTLNFSYFSGLIFIGFLTIVSFFAYRIKVNAKEIFVLTERERTLKVIFDFFTVPIIRVGQWISMEFSKINFFIFIFDIVIEAPFKFFLVMVEEWFGYVKEKKDEIG